MFKIISLFIFLMAPLVVLADKPDTSMHEMEKSGFWNPEDCKKVSDTAGVLLYLSGQALKEGGALDEQGKHQASDEKYKKAFYLAEVAANFAKNFEAFCK